MYALPVLLVLSALFYEPAPGLPERPLVAMCCRFYYPPGDKRTSYHQVYLCRLDGSHRKQITFDKSEKHDLRWVGRQKLAWLESNGVTKTESDASGYHGGLGETKLVFYDLSTGKKRVISRGVFTPQTSISNVMDYPRGLAVYFAENVQEKADVVCTTVTGVWVGSPRGFRRQRRAPDGLHGQKVDKDGRPYVGVDDEDLDITNGFRKNLLKKIMHVDSVEYGTEASITYRDFAATGGGPSTIFRKWGKKVQIYCDQPEYAWSSPDGSKSWIQFGSYAGSAGCDQWITEIDWNKGAARLIADTVLEIDFDPTSRFWAASSNNKGTTALGALQIWQRELWVGDRTTGRQWRIASGPVHGDGPRIQPE